MILNYKKVYNMVVFFILITLYTIPVNSQVTIGMGEKPSSAALLDLKQRASVGGSDNSNLGLAMPRVKLTNMTELYPMFQDTDSEYLIGATRNATKLQSKGLVVYNTNSTTPFNQGLYNWDGSKWSPVNQSVELIGANGLTRNGANMELGGTLSAGKTTTVTLGTTNSTILKFKGSTDAAANVNVHIDGAKALKITDGVNYTGYTGKILTADAYGNATWQVGLGGGSVQKIIYQAASYDNTRTIVSGPLEFRMVAGVPANENQLQVRLINGATSATISWAELRGIGSSAPLNNKSDAQTISSSWTNVGESINNPVNTAKMQILLQGASPEFYDISMMRTGNDSQGSNYKVLVVQRY